MRGELEGTEAKREPACGGQARDDLMCLRWEQKKKRKSGTRALHALRACRIYTYKSVYIYIYIGICRSDMHALGVCIRPAENPDDMGSICILFIHEREDLDFICFFFLFCLDFLR